MRSDQDPKVIGSSMAMVAAGPVQARYTDGRAEDDADQAVKEVAGAGGSLQTEQKIGKDFHHVLSLKTATEPAADQGHRQASPLTNTSAQKPIRPSARRVSRHPKRCALPARTAEDEHQEGDDQSGARHQERERND